MLRCVLRVCVFMKNKDDFEWITTSFVKAKILKCSRTKEKKCTQEYPWYCMVPLGTEVKHINKRTE